VAFASAAEMGGAAGLRLNGPEDVAAVRAQTTLPIIAIHKRPGPDGRTLITSRLEDIPPLIDAGAAIVALDTTDRPRPVPCAELIAAIHAGGALAMADIRTFADAEQAVALGVDLVGTTLSVFDLPDYVPDVELVRQIATRLPAPVIAEGNYWEPADFVRALEAGACAVVIGSAITRPWMITERFVRAARRD
jgi:N-acetylmannosamine-6-phosphate 2-epimerase/N-acetylmannosamine kinase